MSDSPNFRKTSKLGGLDDGNNQPPKDVFEAAQRGVTNFITRLVERTLDFDVNQRDKYNRTALHWAAEMGHVETAEALLDFNSDLSATECNGRTAIHLAARGADVDMLQTLLESVLDKNKRRELVNQTDNHGITPVFLTLQKGEEGKEAFQLLMANGGQFNGLSNGGGAAEFNLNTKS